MSLGLIKPGVRSANLSGLRHPKTGQFIEPIGYLKNGTAVWPVLGGAPDDDDPDDPTFTGSGGSDDEDDEDEDEDDEEEGRRKKKPVKKSKKDEDEDDEDDDEEKLTRPERQAARYRVKLRQQEAENREMAARLKALEDKDKKPDEVVSRDLTETREKLEQVTKQNRTMTLELAFFKANAVDWVDPSDALRLVDLEEVDVDEDGTVDVKALRRALRELAKSKPHLVKKAELTKGRAQGDDDDDEEDDDEPRSRQSANTMNRQRRGTKGKTPSRQELAKKFPVLNRL
jgi:hypothetical protein